MICIVDYGVGNLFSLKSSFLKIGYEVKVTSDREEIEAAKRIILPGVGAFADAQKKLFSSGLGGVIAKEAEKGTPILGICLGMQLLFERSHEYGLHRGLGLIPGEICPISDVISPDLKIPHMGWNALCFGSEKHPLFKYLTEGDHVYFVHSYFAKTDEKNIIAKAEYSYPLTAAVANNNVMGCQFHPEKSGEAGLKILKAFCEGI
ncbi:MAG: imidazole glycerol phosphate synthase subunit HisH [Clostridia bacterium]|nr:imidazole glycerol phosphate synthase subunit HisH [Clostridia bacterium]